MRGVARIDQQRSVRSFVRREGRLTGGQQRALETLWPRFGVDFDGVLLDLDRVFCRQAPRVLEIGFGDGESLLYMAANDPGTDYLGVEVHRPGMGHLLLQAQALDLSNLRVISADAVVVLAHGLPDAGLDRVQIFFPDPWPKKRHHKRRLIQPDFLRLTARALKPGGRLHLATDWEDYAGHMLQVLEAAEDFVNTANGFAPRPAYRPLTRFERRGQRLGHDVWELIFQRR